MAAPVRTAFVSLRALGDCELGPFGVVCYQFSFPVQLNGGRELGTAARGIAFLVRRREVRRVTVDVVGDRDRRGFVGAAAEEASCEGEGDLAAADDTGAV
jgi:hypothetical protein